MRELYETRTVHSPQSINILYYILYHLTSFSSSYSPREEILCNSPQSVSTVVWKVSCVLSLPLEKVRWKKMEIMELSTTSGIMSFEISHFFLHLLVENATCRASHERSFELSLSQLCQGLHWTGFCLPRWYERNQCRCFTVKSREQNSYIFSLSNYFYLTVDACLRHGKFYTN